MHLRFDITASSLPEDVKERLLALRDSRITQDGVLVIKAQQHRSQDLNRLDAFSRLHELVNSVARPPKTRRATKPTYGSRQRRLEGKSQRAETKALRGRVDAQSLAQLDFPLLRSEEAWKDGALPAALAQAQTDIAWAQHIVLFFPLWLGDMPALLKGFLEQVARPGFAFQAQGDDLFARKGLSGRSARVVVTMGMPALLYRWYFRAHSVKNLERNILAGSRRDRPGQWRADRHGRQAG